LRRGVVWVGRERGARHVLNFEQMTGCVKGDAMLRPAVSDEWCQS
jgi:hypothetical protein